MLNIPLASGLIILLAVLFDLLQRKTAFSKLQYGIQQLLIGLGFGFAAIFATAAGVWDGTAAVNVRDAAPLTAGLFFGYRAGLLSGILGALFRYRFGLGQFSKLACSLACVMAGIIGGALRNFLFERKRPNWLYCLYIGGVTEVMHMLMILLIRQDDVATAFEFAEKYTVSMVVLCGIIMVLVSVILYILQYRKLPREEQQQRSLSGTIQRWLLCSVLLAFAGTCVLSHRLQTRLAVREAESKMRIAIQDVRRDVQMAAGGVRGAIVNDSPWRIGQTGAVLICDEDMLLLNGREAGKKLRDSDVFAITDQKEQPENSCYEANIYDENCYCLYIHEDSLYFIAYIPESEVMFYRQVSMYITVFSEVLIFTALFFLIFFITRRFVEENLERVNESLDAISDGRLDTVVNVREFREFDVLSDDINATVNTLKRYIAEAAAQNEKELQFAHAIQFAALPSPMKPQESFSIFARMDTAKEVGGDFYDYYMIDKEHLGFLVADVSGKGIPAAMFMMASKTIIKLLAETGLPVSEIFTRTNNRLCQNNSEEMFVTAWMGILNLRTGVIEFANAGHNPPVLKHADGRTEFFKSRPDLVLAGMPGIRYHSGSLQLAPGDIILLYTDGVTEGINEKQELFGDERLLKTVDNAPAEVSPEGLCSRLKTATEIFAGEAQQFDDMTMLSIRWKGTAAMEKCLAEITLEATVENIGRVTDFVNAELEKLNCPMKAQLQIDIAIDELFGNIVQYAYRPDIGPATIRVSVMEKPMAVVVTFIDHGKPYDPLAMEDPDVSMSAEEREIGGLGVFIVKNSMNEIDYRYEDGQNILMIRKNFE